MVFVLSWLLPSGYEVSPPPIAGGLLPNVYPSYAEETAARQWVGTKGILVGGEARSVP